MSVMGLLESNTAANSVSHTSDTKPVAQTDTHQYPQAFGPVATSRQYLAAVGLCVCLVKSVPGLSWICIMSAKDHLISTEAMGTGERPTHKVDEDLWVTKWSAAYKAEGQHRTSLDIVEAQSMPQSMPQSMQGI